MNTTDSKQYSTPGAGSTQEPNDESLVTSLAQLIDHTKLTFTPQEDKAARESAILALCEEAKAYRFKAVCVRPEYVRLAKRALAGTSVLVATVIGFPLQKTQLAQEQIHPTIGNFPLSEKMDEIRQVIADGVDELDVVINVGQIKADVAILSQKDACEDVLKLPSLSALCQMKALAEPLPLKVIIETDLLTPAEIRQACFWCADAGVAMVKTSTGMVDGGAGGTCEMVDLIHGCLQEYARREDGSLGIHGGHLPGVKASGGIKHAAQAIALLEKRVDRIGTSAGGAIINEVTRKSP